MADFISVSLCRGKRPRQFSTAHVQGRPHLIERMMSHRRVARFLVAPPGYGKSFVALEYAHHVFGLEDTIWLSAFESEFLRKLDATTLDRDVLECGERLSLIVVDGVAHMDVRRADELSRCIDVWLDAGCEVVVTTTPSSDAFARRQIDRLLLKGSDLLVDDREASGQLHANSGLAQRIACIKWQRGEGASTLIRRAAAEALPFELACMSFYIAAVGKGDLQALSYLFPRRDVSAAFVLLSRYPHLGVDVKRQSFEAIEIDPDVLYDAYKVKLGKFSKIAGFEDLDSFTSLIAGRCDEDGRLVRACDVVRAFGSMHLRRSWALRNGVRLLHSLEALSLERLLVAAGHSLDDDGARLLILRGLSNLVLEDGPTAREAASYALALARSDDAAKLCALLLLSRLDPSVDARFVQQRIRRLASEKDDPDFKEVVLEGLIAGGERSLDALACHAGDFADGRMMDLACCWAFSASPSQFAPYLERSVKRLDCVDRLGLSDLMVAKTCQKAVGMGILPADALSNDLILKVFRADTELLRQRSEKKLAEAADDQGGSVADADEKDMDAERSGNDGVPLLEVRLFGHLEASIGGVPVERTLLNRTTARAMLALLALDAGRELTREKLASDLWPESEQRNAMRGCYTSWSALGKALRLPDGSCPYLNTLRHGYKLDRDLVRVDVDRVRAICNSFRMDSVDCDSWQGMLIELEHAVSGGLVPGEGSSPLIVEARKTMHQRITDALVVGSERLLKEGYAMTALDFVGAISGEFELREDVCFTKMRAQMACGQREEALGTYFAAKHHLKATLGIEPSARLTRLYLKIVGGDQQSGGLVDFG